MNACILAGGKSKRFGSNKALFKIGYETLIERVINSIKPFFDKIIIITNEPDDYEFLKVEMKEDIIPGAGSLGGIYTGLVMSSGFKVFFIACDLPDVAPDLIKQLIIGSEGFDVVVPKTNKGFEPLFAIYSKNCIEPIKRNLERGDLKIINFYKQMKVKEIPADRIVNINTLKDLEQYVK
ncbi:MAG: molybdenum cofactor guanylyltransferase [Candidatus Firestonebacteria bacterium]